MFHRQRLLTAAAAGNYSDCWHKRVSPLPLCVHAGLEACCSFLHFDVQVSDCVCVLQSSLGAPSEHWITGLVCDTRKTTEPPINLTLSTPFLNTRTHTHSLTTIHMHRHTNTCRHVFPHVTSLLVLVL